jgi:glc operon protein GlcG
MPTRPLLILAALGLARAAHATDPAVVQLDAARVRAAFATGAVLVDTPGYAVHASRRDAPGEVEIHARDTDVIYVIDGTATMVTGGTPVQPRTVADGEIRATRVEGGDVRALAPGDVLVVPAGTPHWFRDVPGPFVYFVVKPR